MLGKVAIVGTGAVGAYFGGRLAQAGEDVTFLLRSDYDAVASQGLEILSIKGDFHLASPSIAQSPDEIGPVDWIIIAWKTTSNHLFRSVLTPLIGEKTHILTLQNGIGSVETLGDLFGKQRVYGGLCFVCINRIAPGVVEHTANGKITIGRLIKPNDDGLTTIVEAFSVAGVDCHAVPDLAYAQWRKLIWNVPFNGLSITAGGVDTAQILGSLGLESAIRALMAEVIDGARALGHELPDSLIDQQITTTRSMGAYRPSSMIDYAEGRPVEIESIWQEPYTLATSAGAHLPLWEKLLADIKKACDEL